MKKSLFIFFSDINGQIKNELIRISRNNNKDYLIEGKEIISFIEIIKRSKNIIENEKSKFEENYNILK